VNQTPATDALEQRFRQMAHLNGASAILGWDAATMLPAGSGDVRGEQLAALAEIVHEKLTDPAMEDLFAAAAAEKLEGWRAANLREMRHRHQHATAVPAALVTEETKTRIASELQWREAKKTSDFAGYAPMYDRMLQVSRRVAEAKAEALKLSPYDALLDSYDPGMRASTIDPIFADLKTWLPDMVGSVIEAQKRQPVLPLAGANLPTETQDALARDMMQALGFNTSEGRIDLSTHPFCGGVPGDVRITTRYGEDFTESLFGVLHETGHALYEQGLPVAWRGLPIGEARGMTLHESQSLFVEMQLAHSPAFMRFLQRNLQARAGLSGPAWEPANLIRALSQVERSFIRTNADEVTYPLHVILRYELEQALLSGDLPMRDLPGAWAEKMQAYLGITPPDHARGCLQDVHWPEGMYGYFPTYTLGAMTAAQLMDAARRDLPAMDHAIERGELGQITAWLREHVHRHGSQFSTPELIARATGKPLDPAIFKAHLEARYLA